MAYGVVRLVAGPARQGRGLLQYEQIVLDALFKDAREGSGETSVLLSKSGGAYAVLKEARDAMYREMIAHGWYTARPDWVRRDWAINSVAVLCASQCSRPARPGSLTCCMTTCPMRSRSAAPGNGTR